MRRCTFPIPAPMPGAAPVANATIVMRDKRVVAVGPRASVAVPQGATVIDGAGKYVTPGFIDTNVHISLYNNLETLARYLPRATDVVIEDGVNGRLVPVDDEAALAAALGTRLADRAAASSMGARAREAVIARYDVRQTAKQWLAAYQRVLTKTP